MRSACLRRAGSGARSAAGGPRRGRRHAGPFRNRLPSRARARAPRFGSRKYRRRRGRSLVSIRPRGGGGHLEPSLVREALRSEQAALELTVDGVVHRFDVPAIQEAEDLARHVERTDRDRKRDDGLAIPWDRAGLVAHSGAELLAVQLERERYAAVLDRGVVRILDPNLDREPKLEPLTIERLDARDAHVERVAVRAQRR